MLSSALHFGKQFLERFATFVTLVTLVLATSATWLFLQDPVEPSAAWDQERLRLVTLQGSLIRTLDDTSSHRQSFLEEAAHHEARIATAEKVLETLRAGQSRWERWFGDKQEQASLEQRIARLVSLQKVERVKATEARHAAEYWEQENHQARTELERTQAQMDLYDAFATPAFHYLHSAWVRAKWYVLAAAALYFLGRPVRRFLLFYFVAPRVTRTSAMRLGSDTTTVPSVGASAPTLEVPLWPGDILRVKPDHCVSADDPITRRMRWLLDGRLPLTSLLCGFVRVLELHHSHVGGESRVLLVGGEEKGGELLLVHIPDGSSMVLRPSLLAGAIVRSGERLQVRRRWRLFHWQSWATRRFGYFEVSGPCRVVLNTTRPMRAERLASREGSIKPLRRVAHDMEVAFSPGLERRPLRAPRFWSYCRGRIPLFETAVTGDGLLVTKEAGGTVSRDLAAPLHKRLLRPFGL